MRVWQINGWCEPEQMTLAEAPLPVPGPKEVRIRNHAAAINFFDLLQIQGKYQMKPVFPFTPGAEVAGVIDATGPSADSVAVGDRVMALALGGGYGEYSIAAADRVFAMPDRMSYAEAAAMPIVYHTSWFALTLRAQLRVGDWLLVHAGASGVGMSAIQIGRALGARVIATAGSPAKLEFAAKQGADHTLNYNDPAWVEQVKQLTGGHGADIVYDPVGGDVFDLSTRCIAPEGRLLVIGFASGRIPSIAVNRILLKNISVVGAVWGQYVSNKPRYLHETQRELMELYNKGQVKPAVSKTWPLGDAPSALRAVANRQIIGKTVLLMREE